MTTLADLDGTDDEADWLVAGHVLVQQEVDFLRRLALPLTVSGKPRPAPHFGPVHVGRPARFTEHLRVDDWIVGPAGTAVKIYAIWATGTGGEHLLDTSGAVRQWTVVDGEEWALYRIRTEDLRNGMVVEDGGGSDTARTVAGIAATQWEDGPDSPPTEYAVTFWRDGKLTGVIYTAADTEWILGTT